MLQFEPVSSGLDHSRASRHDLRSPPGPGVADGIGNDGIPHQVQRFGLVDKFEQELTFTPKLNATSLRLAHERRTQLKSGITHRPRAAKLASTPHHVGNMSSIPKLPEEFTFKPR